MKKPKYLETALNRASFDTFGNRPRGRPALLSFLSPAVPVWIVPVVLALVLAAATGRAQSGAEDTTYQKPQLNEPVESISLDPVTGEAVVGGFFSTYFDPATNTFISAPEVARINTDGRLDTTFVSTLSQPTSNAFVVNSVAVQPDEKIIVGGNFILSDTVGTHHGIARLILNGQSDVSFNANLGSGADDQGAVVMVVARQPNGKILVGGDFRSFNGSPARGLIRLNADLTRDLSFVPDENRVIDAGFIRALVVQPDGGILVSSEARSYPFRLTAGGALDGSFDASGVAAAIRADSINTVTKALALQADGKVLVYAIFSSTGGKPPFSGSIVRLNSNGSVDGSFDSSPKISPTIDGSVPNITTILPQSDGTVVFAGDFSAVGGVAHKAIARLQPNGLQDGTFNAANLGFGTVSSLALQDDGRLLVGAQFVPLSRLFDVGAVAPASALNISTRLNVLTGDNVLIGGFIITGTDPKKIIVRGIGPSLGLAGALADPILELHKPGGIVLTNDNWRDTQEQEIIDSTVPPTNNLESAILVTLNPGAYTVVLAGKNNGTGIGLVEAYDLDQTASSQLANISTRGFVETDDNVMIAGFIIGGEGGGGSTIVARGIGPSLTTVANALQDPTLELHDSNGALIASNDNWMDSPDKQTIINDSLAPTDGKESALLATLAPAGYTVVLRGVNNTTGVGLVEVYNLQ
jgi:uncharacterized delta-60 repeat protein